MARITKSNTNSRGVMKNNPFLLNPAIVIFLIISQNCVSDSSNIILHRWLHRLQFIVSYIIPEGLPLYVRWLCLVRRRLFHLRYVVNVQGVCTEATGQRDREGIENGKWKWSPSDWEYEHGVIEWGCQNRTSENRIVPTILHAASGDDNSSRVFGLIWAASYCGNYYWSMAILFFIHTILILTKFPFHCSTCVVISVIVCTALSIWWKFRRHLSVFEAFLAH